MASKFDAILGKLRENDAFSGSYNDLQDLPTLGTAATLNYGTSSGQVPILDGLGKLNINVLPGVALTDTFVVASEAAMLALSAETGDVAVRSDLNKSYILKGTDPTVFGDWQELLTPTDNVHSVFGRQGTVTAQTNDYTWAQIDKSTSSLADITTRSHTLLSDIGTNSHTQIDTAIANSATHIANTSNPHSVTATQVGLGNLTNDAQLKIASNLSDLANVTTARSNLGLGTLATQSGTFSGGGTLATGGFTLTVPATGTVALLEATNVFSQNLTVGTDTTTRNLNINGPSGIVRSMQYQTAGVNRWLFQTDSVVESGGNSGTNFRILARSDAGGPLHTPFFIERATGWIGFGTSTPTYPFEVSNTGLTTVIDGTEYETIMGFKNSANHTIAMGGNATTQFLRTTFNNDDLILVTRTGGANFERVRIKSNGDVLIGTTTDNGQLTVDQPSTTAAEPVLYLGQADVSEEFIEFVSTSAADNNNPISTTALGAYAGKLRINVNGTYYWLPYYNS